MEKELLRKKPKKTQETLKEGRILIRDVSVNDSEYILINLYNTDNKKEQVNVMSNMFVLSEKFETNSKPQLNIVGVFKLFFDSKLDAQEILLSRRIL